MELRDIVKRYRTERGLSQRGFARTCGLSYSFISMLESGANPNTKKPMHPSLKNLQALAEAMNMTTRALIDMADDITLTDDGDDPTFPEIALVNESGKRLAREFVLMLSKMDEYKK